MKKGLGKKWLALLMAALLALPALTLEMHYASAEETTEASEPAPAEEKKETKKEEKKEEVKVEEKKEAPKEETKTEEKKEEPKQETKTEEKKEEPKQETKTEEKKEEVPEVKTETSETKTEAPKEEPKQESSKPSGDSQDMTVEENTKPAPEPEPEEDPEPTPSPTPTIPPETEEPEADAPADAETPVPEVESTPEAGVDPEATPDPEATVLPDVSVEPTEEPTPTPEPRPDHFKLLGRSKSYANNYLNAGSLPIPDVGMAIPLIYQYDYTRDVCEVDGDGRSVASSGCGATAASMIIAYVAGNYDQTPYSLFYWAAKNGRYFGDGLDYDTVRSMLSRYGVESRMESVSEENIIKALAQNHPIIINMGPGTFTKHGHYIVLRGLDSDGEVLVNDPNSSSRSRKSYTARLIAGEAKRGQMLVVTTMPGDTEADIAELAIDEPFEVEDVPADIDMLVDEDMQLMEVEALIVEDIGEEEVIEDMNLQSFLSEAPAAEFEQEIVTEDPSAEFALETIEEADLREKSEAQLAEAEAPAEAETPEQEEAEPQEAASAPEQDAADVPAQEAVEESAAEEPVVPAAEPFEPFWAEVIVETVNLRDAPGKNGKISALAGIGMRFMVVEERTMNSGAIWYGVDNAGQVMYLRGDMIVRSEAMPEASAATMDGTFEQAYTAEVVRDKVNLRKQPGRQGEVIENVLLGTQVQVIDEVMCDEDGFVWCEVDYNGQILYVRSDMLAAN